MVYFENVWGFLEHLYLDIAHICYVNVSFEKYYFGF